MNWQRIKRRHEALNWWAEGTRSNLTWFGGWIWSGFAKHWALLGMLALAALAGGVGLMSVLPQAIACPSAKSFCYILRLDKESVVLPVSPKRYNSDQNR